MKLRTQSAARIGKQKINLTLAYQACNQDACLPPTKVAATADIEVAESDAATHPVNTDVFSQSPPSIRFPTHR